jgi:hypothetical protein
MITIMNIIFSAIACVELFKPARNEEDMIISAKKLAFVVPAQLVFNILALVIA